MIMTLFSFEHQYGFRLGKNTFYAIFDVLSHYIYNDWNARIATGCIFVDFSWAFETICRSNIKPRSIRKKS